MIVLMEEERQGRGERDRYTDEQRVICNLFYFLSFLVLEGGRG